jgi:N-acetylglucosaminyldiphosphoundecaprenol N-acetyl-beta-D-mannosaminyltransferase
MQVEQTLESRRIVDVRVDGTSYEDATTRVLRWAKSNKSRYVCVATVHSLMEAHDDPTFRAVMNEADLVTPDGMPLVWGLRRLGIEDASRVYGPDLTPVILERAAAEGVPVGFYGVTDEVMAAFSARVLERWPSLRIAYRYSPPFRSMTEDEDMKVVEDINASGARILMVGLGCPRQESWMADHRGRIDAVMVGVGAAFDFIAGAKRQAPLVMQRSGTEWIFRLATEPRRLWRRYLRHNPRFVALFAAQLVRTRARAAG